MGYHRRKFGGKRVENRQNSAKNRPKILPKHEREGGRERRQREGRSLGDREREKAGHSSTERERERRLYAAICVASATAPKNRANSNKL